MIPRKSCISNTSRHQSTQRKIAPQRFKSGYDCVSCLDGVAMSFFAFGLWHFEGVKWGTILCALINGYVIGRFSAFYEMHWTFCDRFPWWKYFAPDAAAQTSAE